MISDKAQRKVTKSIALAEAAEAAIPDVLDFLRETPITDWDLDVLRAHRKVLEAAGCQIRRMIEDEEIKRAAA